MENYKRKSFYQDRAIAKSYFEKRFSHPKGRRENEATRLALGSALRSIPGVERVLDMPCGTGRFTNLFFEGGYFYVGGEISMEMLETLAVEQREQGKTPPLVRCDGEHLPFKDDVFDCVVCIRFLNLVPVVVREKILKEMMRVSRNWLIVQSHHLKVMGPFTLLKVFIKQLFGRDVSKYQLGREITSVGWKEKSRVRVRHTRHCVGVYHKNGTITVQQ